MRRRCPPLLLGLALFASRAPEACAAPQGETCFSACQMSLRPAHFTDAAASKLSQACLSRLRTTSLYLCLELHCPGNRGTEGLARQNETCAKYLETSLPSFGIIADYTQDAISRVRRLEHDEAGARPVFAEVVIPSAELFRLAYDTLDAWTYVYDRHVGYGAALFLFWGLVIALGMSSHLVSAIRLGSRGRYEPLSNTEEDGGEGVPPQKGPGPGHGPSRWLKRHFSLPATFGYRRAQNVGWCTVPPRIQTITIFAFTLLNVFFCVNGYWVFRGNMYWPDISKQLWRYVSDRTGIVSFANFPLVWVFGMRNNLLLWLTGWDFGTYNNFHRWVARVATVQAVVHSVGYTVLALQDGGWPYYAAYWTKLFWWTGELATIFMCLLLGLSVFWMRRKAYEAFLVVHIVFSMAILVTMLGHVSIFDGRFDGLIWACVLIWGLDRLLRVVRVLAFNPRFWATRAKATYNPESNVVRLVVPYARSLYLPKAGTFYYLHVLNDSRFWESHPFTVASVTARREAPAGTDEDKASRPDGVGLLLQDESAVESDSGERPPLPKAHSTMTFLLRPYDSFTARLRDTAAAARPPPASLRVLVDGPYGHTQRLDLFTHVLFIVGGSGIVVPLSYLDTILGASARTKTARIVWAAREPELAAEVVREDFSAALDGGTLSVDIHITKDGGGAGASAGAAGAAGWPSGVRVVHERPDVRAEVDCAARCAAGGSLAVVACGPGRMADDARAAAVDALGRWSGLDMEYFEESFGW